jgi:membrane-associated phospholipid phosphatase
MRPLLGPTPSGGTALFAFQRTRTVRRLPGAARALVLTAMVSVACWEQPTTSAKRVALASALDAAPQSPTPTTSVRWNEIARGLVASHNTNGPLASRVYALVSMAELAAVAAVDDADRRHGPDAAGGVEHPSLQAAVARASWGVLTRLYPDPATAELLAAMLRDDEAAPVGPPERHLDVLDGDAIGSAIAQVVLARAGSDGAAAADCPATPPTPATQFWHDDAVPPNPQPQLPCFGNVRPWLHMDVSQFRADPPPAFGSAAFLAGLADVRQISDTRTAQQLAIVDKWLDGNNTFTPPGHWNLIASDLITRHHLREADAARALAVLNIAMMDTHIACWDRKFTYWEIRPWQADPLITTPRGRPHHPANPSGHACAGGAGSGAVAGLFPAERDSLLALGDEEGFTTVLSGVHYRLDVADGLRIGRTIAAMVLELHARGDLLELLTDEGTRRR